MEPMSPEVWRVIQDFTSPLNTLLLGGILFLMREVRTEIRKIKETDLVHVDERMRAAEAAIVANTTSLQNVTSLMLREAYTGPPAFRDKK